MPKKVLIIDDEPEICKKITGFLFDAGYAASYALNGPDGLAMIKRDSPSLVLLDIGMPGMDGIEVMRLIHEQFPALPVIVLTDHQDTETVKKAIELGASEYLTKPVNPETLLNQFVRDMIGKP
ncbi:MAG: response regulator [Candidatus Omnitrophota bacterium]|jgi:DNA-binding response OmpR family regulator